MFGFFRYRLSTLVVIAHIFPALAGWTGVYAVFGFYMLSGCLMTLVLSENYGFT